MLPPNYGDGVYSMSRSKKNLDLPNARLLANAIYPSVSVPDPTFTLILMQFGQYLAHDLGSQIDKTDDYFCCKANGSWTYCDPTDTACVSIPIPPKDPIFPPSVQCMDFKRSVTDHDLYCNYPNSKPQYRPFNQINEATSYIDHSPTYGNSYSDDVAVRNYTNGLLKTQTINKISFSPPQSGVTTCTYQNESCFVFWRCARGNTNIGLFTLQTIFYNEHNRIAIQLRKINPNWSDEMLFETARKINIGVLQHITYDRFLPNILDPGTLESKKIVKANPQNSYINDYDPYRIAGTFNEFTTGANRYFHTQIQGMLQ